MRGEGWTKETEETKGTAETKAKSRTLETKETKETKAKSRTLETKGTEETEETKEMVADIC